VGALEAGLVVGLALQGHLQMDFGIVRHAFYRIWKSRKIIHTCG
jgi:hypothetical protein